MINFPISALFCSNFLSDDGPALGRVFLPEPLDLAEHCPGADLQAELVGHEAAGGLQPRHHVAPGQVANLAQDLAPAQRKARVVVPHRGSGSQNRRDTVGISN